MFKRLSKSRAQTTLEYAVLIGVIVAALIAMQRYLKRGYQGKLRESADQMGEQFSPGYTKVLDHRKSELAETYEEQLTDGSSSTTFTNDHVTKKLEDSYQQVKDLTNEDWPLK